VDGDVFPPQGGQRGFDLLAGFRRVGTVVYVKQLDPQLSPLIRAHKEASRLTQLIIYDPGHQSHINKFTY
jgi:hypothetical protein